MWKVSFIVFLLLAGASVWAWRAQISNAQREGTYARARVAKEEQSRKALADGQLGLDLYGLRDKLAARGVRYVAAGDQDS